ncbi:MAG: polynucleotide adenylyltransferase PcnB [Gammaproteobacteria bacterium]|nr:MAG: polynucleotide adenylyltransferase PcnB [Gammaproteobacteria bacterium]
MNEAQRTAPVVYPRERHSISRANISPNALKVLYRLHHAGYQACLVGGGVRDLLLGREPKDFDVATDARPEEVRRLFRNSRLIGRRFRLVHVVFGREIVEVATFRGMPRDDGEGERVVDASGRIVRDNLFGTIEEDAWRRDFTVNALYYDISDFTVRDYVGGMEDLEAGRLRLIGEPRARFLEDPVRMLRAVRFAAKLGFRLDPGIEALLPEMAHLIGEVSPARLFDEVLKLFHGGCALETFELLRRFDLFRYLFPLTEAILAEEEAGFPRMLVARALANTDARVQAGKPVTPAFLYAALLWEPMRRRMPPLDGKGMSEIQAIQVAGTRVVTEQVRHTAIPRRFSLAMREIWALQPRFARRTPRQVRALLGHPRFRAAYDFLLLRAEAGEVPADLAQWWTELQALPPEGQAAMVQALGETEGKRRRRRRRRRRSAAQE